MKNWSIKKGLALVVFVLMGTVASAAVSPVGTWDYRVPEAPIEYVSGELIVGKVNSEYTVKFKINGTELEARNVKYSASNLTFATYVEGEYVTFKMKVSGKKMTGKVSYSEGQLDMTATKR